jgi:glycosyltransferase involved in cell wall biosynthesis
MLSMTLASVLQQQGVSLEVIVVDDGSTDDTVDRVANIRDARVKLVRNTIPLGVSAARNRGIGLASGPWIAFLDDDDLWAPNKLSIQLDAAMTAGAEWAYSGSVKIDAHERIIGGEPPPNPPDLMATLRRLNPVPGGCSGVIVRRTALDSVGAFDTELSNLADWDLWIRLGETGAPACATVPLVAYRLHGGQASLDVDLIVREMELIKRKHGVRIDRGRFDFYLAHKCLLGGRRRTALKYFLFAALHGSVREVGAVFLSTLRTRLADRIPLLRPNARVSDGQWLGEASAWLSQLSAPPAKTVVPRRI